jgi:acetone carboxylase gamma subunit
MNARESEEATMQLDHHLEITEEGRYRCRKCGHDLGSAATNFKQHAVCKVRPIEYANPLIVDPATFIDDEVVFRQYFCPGCATLLENEVILADSEPVWDKQVEVAEVKAHAAG